MLVEACFHLPLTAQRQRLHAPLHQLEVALLPRAPDRRYRQRVFEQLLRYAEREPDRADACLAILSSEDSAARLWTYDREFLATWRREKETVISRAVP